MEAGNITLYLIGKASDSSLVFASDGRSIDKEDKTITDDHQKFHYLPPNLVLAMSGLGAVLENLQIHFGQLNSSPNGVLAQYAIRSGSENVVIRKIAEFFRDKLVREGKPYSALDSDATLISWDQSHPMYTRIMITGGSSPDIEISSDAGFSYLIGGSGRRLAGKHILQHILGGNARLDVSSMLGFFNYILEQVSGKQEGVGGDRYFAVLGERGYGALDHCLLDIDKQTERMRPMFRQGGIGEDLARVLRDTKGNKAAIEEMMRFIQQNQRMDSLVELCEDAAYTDKPEGAPYHHAAAAFSLLMSLGSVIEEHKAGRTPHLGKKILPYHAGVVYALMGSIALRLGDRELAKTYFDKAGDLNPGSELKKEAEASIRCFKGGFRLGQVPRQGLEWMLENFVQSSTFTVDEIRRIQ